MLLLSHIIKYKLISFLKSESNFSSASVLKSIGTSLVYIIFAFGTYLFTKSIIEYLLTDVRIGLFLLHRFIFIVLFLFFIAVNIGNIVVSFSTMYKAREVAFLLSKPVSFTKLFAIKFLDNFFYSSSTLLLIITAVIFGYAEYFSLPWYFVPFAILFLILPFMFIAGSLGSIILLFILRLSMKYGVRIVLSTIAISYAAFVIIFYYFSSPAKLVNQVFEYYPNIDAYFGFLESPLIQLLPNYWLSEALYWISTGNLIAAAWFVYILCISAIFFFLIALFISKYWYYKTWIASHDMFSSLIAENKKNNEFFGFENESTFSHSNESLLKREFLLFFREPSQWAHLSVMIFLITIFVSSIGSIDVIILNAYNIYLKTLVYLIVYLFNVFLIATLSLRFVFPLVSIEGESIWKIRSAPINHSKFLLKRLAIYFIIIFSIGQILNFFSSYQFSLILAVLLQINTALVTITLVSLNFCMGSIFSNYKEKNAIRIASSQGASITFLFTIFYLIFLIILLFGPVANYFSGKTVFVSDTAPLIFATIILFFLTTVLTAIFLKTGIKYFKKDVII